MEILIDESGSFVVDGALENSWCVVAAYACPATEKKKYQKVLRDLKLREKVSTVEEIKIHQVSERNFFQFLEDLNVLKGVLFSTATDSGFNMKDLVQSHQKNQTLAIMENINEMKYQSGKKAIAYLTSQLHELPVQLYIQLVCQIQLMLAFIYKGIPYFVQRYPSSLQDFRWKIDQKEPSKITDFEDAFEKFSPALLQSFSIEEPGPRLDWCDYRPMKHYLHKKGEIPDYLIDKFPYLKNQESLDIQKIIRKDIKFIDSKTYSGIQIVDFLASGLRKLLRQGFTNNELAARLLGNLMVQGVNNTSPIDLITFGNEKALKPGLAKLVRILINSCRPMIKNANKGA